MARKRLDQKVYQYLLEKIEKEELAERERITEESLQKELGISRTPVRKALRDLADKGYLENIPNVGVFVKAKEINQKEFQERVDFIELLMVNELFQLEKKEIVFDLRALNLLIEKMLEKIREKEETFEEEVIHYFEELLNYSQNSYSKRMTLRTLREIFMAKTGINRILKDNRQQYFEHLIELVNQLEKNDYPLARREIRILMNKMKLDVIEKS